MNVVGIYGSPRKGGNTDRMMDAFLWGVEDAGGEVDRVYVRRLKMQGCLGCGGCDETGKCVVKDDMQQVYPLLDNAQGIVVASPIYFYGVTGQLKLLVDRSQAFFMRKMLAQGGEKGKDELFRRGFLLSAGATKGKRLFDCAMLCIRYFFDAIEASYMGELCFRGVDAKGDIEKIPSALESCREAGRHFVESGTGVLGKA